MQTLKQLCRSPLRYPGGKSRAVKNILQYIPKDTKKICSPFLGGGSVELACASLGIEVFAYDFFLPLIEFWKMLLSAPQELAYSAEKYLGLSKAKFSQLQKKCMQTNDKKEMAAIYYVLNRSSFSGVALSGGMNKNAPRFTKTSIQRVMNFRINNMRVEKMDFKDSLELHKKSFLFLDPPYANGKKLYGHKGDCQKNFDHKSLAKILNARGNWLMSYNDSDFIRALYKDFQVIPMKWAYGMNASKLSNEILILGNRH